MTNHSDVGGKIGTALASIGSFVAAFVQSDTFINELVRLFSSCVIAALGALIGYKITRWLRLFDQKRDATPPNVNVGSEAPKTPNSRARKAIIRKNYAAKNPKKEE